MSLLFVVDTETTALKPSEGGIWDVAAVAVRDGEIVDEWQSLVWPGRERLQDQHLDVIRRVSGIEPGEVLLMLNSLDVPPPATARQNLIRWMYRVAGIDFQPSIDAWKSAKRQPVRVTSFNAAFDRAWLDALPWEVAYFARALGPAELEWSKCVMQAACDVMGPEGALEWSQIHRRWKRPKLPKACEFFGVPFTETHRALTDARAAAQLATKLGIN